MNTFVQVACILYVERNGTFPSCPLMKIFAVDEATCFKNKYISYEQACEFLNMDTLFDRRESKCLKFAKSCLAEKHMKKIFPLNKSKSHHEKFKVNRARTSRYKNSTVIHMQKLLNIEC